MKRLTIALTIVGGCTSDVRGSGSGDAAPAESPPVPTVEVAPGVHPEPAQPAPTKPRPIPGPMGVAKPPQLALALFGECRFPDVHVVGDEVFVQHRGSVHRMGPDGTPAETFPFELRYKDPEIEGFEPAATRFHEVGGRWPDQLYAVADYGMRDYQARKLARWNGSEWAFANVLGRRWTYNAVWPWHDNSILTLAHHWYDDSLRLGVVRGAGKGPKLKLLMRKAGCLDLDHRLDQVHVAPDGPVTAIASCKRTVLARWEPGDRDGTTHSLAGNRSDDIYLGLDDSGNGYIHVDADRSSLFRIVDGEVTKQPLPSLEPVTALAVSPANDPWIVADGVVQRREGEEWHVEELPGDEKVVALAGVAVSAPWLTRKDGTAWARLANETWSTVDLPEVGPERTDSVPVRIVVAGAGDAWVVAKYRKLRNGRKTMTQVRAVYTERNVDSPHECKR